MCYWLLPLFHPKLKVFLDYSVNKVLSRFRLHFPVAVNVNSSLSRGSLSVWGVWLLLTSNRWTRPRGPSFNMLCPKRDPKTITLGGACWMLVRNVAHGVSWIRVPWHRTSGMGICSRSLWYLTSVVCFCSEIVIFNSTDELRVPQFVDLT
jgi:hypothetical protein